MVQCGAAYCSTPVTVFCLCLWSEGNSSLGDIALGFIPRTGPFLWSVFRDAHGPYHLSVKPVGPYQKGHHWGMAESILLEQFQRWSASIRSFLLPSNLFFFFCLCSCGTMTSRKKVLLKVIILGDSGWVMKGWDNNNGLMGFGKSTLNECIECSLMITRSL